MDEHTPTTEGLEELEDQELAGLLASVSAEDAQGDPSGAAGPGAAQAASGVELSEQEEAELDDELELDDEGENEEIDEGEAAELEDETAEPSKKESATTPRGDRAKWERAARLGKLSDTMIEAATDEELSAWYVDWLERERELNVGHEAAARRRELEDRRTTDEPDLTREARDGTTGSEDLTIPDELRAELGAGGAEALNKHVQARVDQAVERAVARFQADRDAEREARAAWGELVEGGDLGDEASIGAFDQALNLARDLAPAKGKWSSLQGREKLRELLRTAWVLEHGAAPKPSVKLDESKERIGRSKKRGRMAPRRGRKAAARITSDEERDNQALSKILSDL